MLKQIKSRTRNLALRVRVCIKIEFPVLMYSPEVLN